MIEEGTILTPAVLRKFADSPMSPFWEGQARQIIAWAADLIEAAEAMKDERSALGKGDSQ
jgi:hypothetical protein